MSSYGYRRRTTPFLDELAESGVLFERGVTSISHPGLRAGGGPSPRTPGARVSTMRWEEFRAEVRRRKERRWRSILSAEGPGRPAGRRPRDPEQEALLAELDRRRIARNETLSRARRVPVEKPRVEEPPRGHPSSGTGPSRFR